MVSFIEKLKQSMMELGIKFTNKPNSKTTDRPISVIDI